MTGKGLTGRNQQCRVHFLGSGHVPNSQSSRAEAAAWMNHCLSVEGKAWFKSGHPLTKADINTLMFLFMVMNIYTLFLMTEAVFVLQLLYLWVKNVECSVYCCYLYLTSECVIIVESEKMLWFLYHWWQMAVCDKLIRCWFFWISLLPVISGKHISAVHWSQAFVNTPARCGDLSCVPCQKS